MSVIYFDNLCTSREGPFWSDNYTTYNLVDPDLTLCFEYSILEWTPAVYLLIFLTIHVYQLSEREIKFGWREVSRFCKCKVVISLVLAILCLSAAINVLIHSDEHGPVLLLGWLVAFMCYTVVACTIVYEFRKQVNSSGMLFWFWLLRLFCSLVQVQTALRHPLEDDFLFAMLLVTFALIIVQLLLHCFADNQALAHLYPDVINPLHRKGERIPLLDSSTDSTKSSSKKVNYCPEIFRSFLFRITYLWFTSYTLSGLKKQLSLSDCWELQQPFRAETNAPRINREWEKELKRVGKKEQENEYGTGFTNKAYFQESINESTDDILAHRENFINQSAAPKSTKKPAEPSFVRAFTLSTLPTFLIGAVYRIFYDLLTLLQPLLLNLLLNVVNGSDPIRWHGAVLTAAMIIHQLFRMVLLNEHFKLMWFWIINARTTLVSAIYRKALRMSTSARKDATAGEIVNLMSVDTQRVSDASFFLHMIYSIPLNLIVGFYLLYQQLGVAAFAGMGVMLVIVPLNVYLSNRFDHYQSLQLNQKDERLKLMTEVLNGIKILKLYGWETSYANLVNAIRKVEVRVLKLGLYFLSFESASLFVCPFLISFFSFMTYILVDPNNVLTPTKVFSALSVVNILNVPISVISLSTTLILQCWISLRRVEKFMRAEEVSLDSITHEPKQQEALVIERGEFAWDITDREPFLQNINLRVKPGSLVSVVGHVGSGKTSLLHAVLGEMHKIRGKVSINGKIAYVPQQAWIFNGTIRENILFGQAYSQQRYNRVVEACALTTDLAMFAAGDLTEIGERGANLSGGQKQRISLARAVYQMNTSLFLLDDPLSAVDAHVGRHIFENVIGPNGLLGNKSRIFVTHRLSTLPSADLIVVLRNGEVSEMGSFNQLMAQNSGFADFIREFLTEEELRPNDEAVNEENNFKETLRKQLTMFSNSMEKSQTHAFSRTSVTRRRATTKVEGGKEKSEPTGQLIAEEEVKVGSLNKEVYGFYFRAIGLVSFVVTLVAYVCIISGIVGTNFWLGVWTSQEVSNDSDLYRQQTISSLVVYASIGLYQVLAILVESLMISYGLCSGARILHDILMHRIMRAPTSFFDTTPLGRIINRFSRDIEAVDTQIPQNLPFFLFTLASVTSTLAIIAVTAPILIALVIPILIAFWVLFRLYIGTVRQVKRLDSILRSPIYAHFHTTLLGATSIRSYHAQERFMAKCDLLMNQDQMTVFVQLVSYRWIYVVLELLNCLIVLVTCIFALTTGSTLASGMASLLITYPLALTNTVNNVLRVGSDLETYMVSVERIQEYTTVESEAPLEVAENDSQLSPQWPETGRVEFRDYSVRYRAGLDLVLKNIDLVVKGGEKVGIVGRTGAGKSSLSLALFRIIEPASGTIVIDGCDIRKIGLQKLRTRLTIIPQDPVLFSGQLRINLDPFNVYTDDQIWGALESAHLKDFIASLDGQLQYVCSEGGENFSVGQRQLLCLARALLRRTKILLLDEATAAVDMETDELIQETIKIKFTDCTILTIAHRLNTIMDYDKILVLEQGRVKEFDKPSVLLADKSTIFYSLAHDARLV